MNLINHVQFRKEGERVEILALMPQYRSKPAQQLSEGLGIAVSQELTPIGTISGSGSVHFYGQPFGTRLSRRAFGQLAHYMKGRKFRRYEGKQPQ